MATTDLTSALDEAGVSYELLPHAHTESALAEAQALGVSPDDVAKTLVVKMPGGYVRAVLLAPARLDLHKLRKVHGGGRGLESLCVTSGRCVFGAVRGVCGSASRIGCGWSGCRAHVL